MHNTFTVPCEKSKIVKNILAFFSRFLVKLICCIVFGSVSSACCLLKSISIISK